MTNAALKEDVVAGRDVPIAVRDYGGTGSPVVLIHGAGRTLADFSSMASTMGHKHRVVAMDLRCHGRSGDGPWTWEAILDDLAAVIDHFQLDRPAIVGHSLGGVIAALWTAEHPECRGGVNLDGHGPGTPDLYDGYSVEEAIAKRAGLEARMKELTAGMSASVPLAQVDAIIEAQKASPLAASLDPEHIEESFRRLLSIEGDMATPRPVPANTEALTKAAKDLDLIALYAKTQAPLQIFNCVNPGPGNAMIGLDWVPDFMAAYRRGLAKALAGLAEREELISYVEFDGDHGLILNQPGTVAELVEEFLTT